ncbi:hypothetical protein [Variovorax paradoxus]|uniref:hypothetical protein n=1 Tax=Variovorax paradoxus TaxID=34073 RepID=UPI00247FE460|nr:hypothetical protein [Variovorax paradoxus]WGT63680.1 hypothetical protein QHG62_27245 [Variovorax paradoxus]
MPTDLKCPSCDLRVSIGGYFTSPKDGFSGRSLVPCGACGTQHAIKHGIRGSGPEYIDIQKVVVDSCPLGALDRVVVRIQKFRKPKATLPEALAIARNAPFTLVESTSAGQALQIVEDLEKIEIQSHQETIGRERNPLFGPPQSDRIAYHARPQHGDVVLPWLETDEPVPADVSAMRCMACGSLGTLLRTAPSALCCPACRKANLAEAGFWLT